MARLRIEDLSNLEFEIAKSDPPVLQGESLTRGLRSTRKKNIFLKYDHTIDGPQTAARLIQETLTSYGAIFQSSFSASDMAVWIGGTGRDIFTFVVLDPKKSTKYCCYACGPRELTGAIMSAIASFPIQGKAVKPWWKFWV